MLPKRPINQRRRKMHVTIQPQLSIPSTLGLFSNNQYTPLAPKRANKSSCSTRRRVAGHRQSRGTRPTSIARRAEANSDQVWPEFRCRTGLRIRSRYRNRRRARRGRGHQGVAGCCWGFPHRGETRPSRDNSRMQACLFLFVLGYLGRRILVREERLPVEHRKRLVVQCRRTLTPRQHAAANRGWGGLGGRRCRHTRRRTQT
ncbi:uncharacterized protein P884DRAFT_69738 [Thermothelomyces heterothallicus CBS 202.75]|uniref:uncharacterized protein n=1 Tax=Thermothelomyces heterothallicus CBS 202.75 TaxID=1149848 RepID=UPI003742F805